MGEFKNKEGLKTWVKLDTETKDERTDRMKEWWTNLKPFKTCYDVPKLPIVDGKEWKEFYIPILIEAGAIPKKDLVIGQYYIGNHRCTKIAKWNGEVFEYWKLEFFPIEDKCNHFEDDNRFSLFVPIGVGTKEEFDKENYENWKKEKDGKD